MDRHLGLVDAREDLDHGDYRPHRDCNRRPRDLQLDLFALVLVKGHEALKEGENISKNNPEVTPRLLGSKT